MSSGSSPPLLDALADSVAACLDAPSVRAIANLELDTRAKNRLDELADKANEGQLTPDERTEYETFISISDFIGLAQLRARTKLGLPLTS
jgi:hypothetical protein